MSHIYSFLHVYVFGDYNAFRSIESLCRMVRNCEIWQTKNQRL